jgi:SAM-dependent methyltransferase
MTPDNDPTLISTDMSKIRRRSFTAFDRAAVAYDTDAANNLMMRWLRRESLRHLTRAFRADDTVLEIGCGTGVEAIALARRGVRVVATDASAVMVAVVEERLARNPGLSEMVTARVLPAEKLGDLLASYGPASFDGAYSSLGPLNCVEDVGAVAASLAQLVRPGGKLVVSLLNKYCLWETAWYLAARKPSLAFRRWRGYARGTAVPGGPPMDVFYWPVAHIERTFRQAGFGVTARRSLPWALPPTYAAHVLKGRPRLFSALRRIERGTARMWPFYTLGDHVHLVFTKREA